MLVIKIPESTEMWDEEREEFLDMSYKTVRLEHSLVSISKWEMKWHKSFLNTKEKTNEEILDYIRCMVINDVDDNVLHRLTADNIKDINEYINNPMTATTFSNRSVNHSRDVITSELIYFWMISYRIPVEFENWHINRLLTLIRVCDVKNNPPKKMSKGELMKRNAAINAARRSKYKTTG